MNQITRYITGIPAALAAVALTAACSAVQAQQPERVSDLHLQASGANVEATLLVDGLRFDMTRFTEPVGQPRPVTSAGWDGHGEVVVRASGADARCRILVGATVVAEDDGDRAVCRLGSR